MLTSGNSIVFVHGLQGHPRGTWTKGRVPITRERRFLPESGPLSSKAKKVKRGSLAWISEKLKRRSLTPGTGADVHMSMECDGAESLVALSLDVSSRNTANVSNSAAGAMHGGGMFWPADLLPQACPRARILVYGYDTKITKYGAAPTNKNSIYSHAKDLLFALSRETENCITASGRQRQILFVAHSLGGIVIKEVSNSLQDPRTKILSPLRSPL